MLGNLFKPPSLIPGILPPRRCLLAVRRVTPWMWRTITPLMPSVLRLPVAAAMRRWWRLVRMRMLSITSRAGIPTPAVRVR